MDPENTVYPLSRYWYSGDFRFYYAYGNTPPQDFLQNISAEREPSILVLGCGDIRSCFYSLWKNFDVKGPVRFDGAHFLLNDISPAILARNILFLYLCLKMPEEESALRKWLGGMWAIWYCHELHQEHYDMLNESLRALCHHTEAWASKDNPLHPLVMFSSPATLKEVKGMWQMWLDHDIDVSSVKEMFLGRESHLAMQGWAHNQAAHAVGFTEGVTQVPLETCICPKNQVQKIEVLEYLKRGSIFAESVLGINPLTSKTFINYTFYERPDGKYNIHYRSIPFSCYHQVVEFTSNILQSHLDKPGQIPFLVKDEHFASSPFLANSVQQFSVWLLCSHKVFCSKQKWKLSFSFASSHALTLCYELENGENNYPLQRFDLIYSSNLMDHLGPPNLILSAVPLLKEGGFLFTTTLYKKGISSLEEYLAISFGFSPKFYPVLLGVRCINHEGEGYASAITAQPCPVTPDGQYVFSENLLIWEKLPTRAVPLVFMGKPLSDVLAEALLCCVQVCVYSLLKTPKLPPMITNLCLETVIRVLSVFIANTCAGFDYNFWKPLISLMQKSIKPYLSSMQTQLFLHDIHMHITVSEKDCPVCLKTPLGNSVGLFSLTFFTKEDYRTPTFMAIVHKESDDRAESLCHSARTGGKVHVFDCVSPTTTGDNSFLELFFYAPLNLVKEGYNVSIIVSKMSSVKNVMSNKMYLPTQPLKSLLTSESLTRFRFFKASPADRTRAHLQSFGTITSHVSDGDMSNVTISLLEPFRAVSCGAKLQPKMLTSSLMQISFGMHRSELIYPYPIANDSVQIIHKRKRNQLRIQCPRAAQEFYKEKPFFIASPNKEMSLAPPVLSNTGVRSLCGQQLTRSEREMVATNQTSTLLRLKEMFALFLQGDEPVIHFTHPDRGVVVLVLRNQKLYDYENKVPVVDLAFCFLEESFVDAVVPGWIKIAGRPECVADIDDKLYELLHTVLRYFSNRTNASCYSKDSNLINKLSEEGIARYFTRAVVYPLLCNPDEYISLIHDFVMNKHKPQVDHSLTVKRDNCSNCGMSVVNIRMCSNCRSVKYCTKKCQRLHWPTHKQDCKKTTSVCDIEHGPKPQPNVHQVSEIKKPSHPLFPLARYWYGGDFNYYYAYGNTPAEDFLQNCPGVKEPSVLLLGCGDIRSCFCSLWKHFDTSVSTSLQFDGVHFVLNDWNSAVLARNIVFLYLCLHLPKEEEAKKSWLCAMWAIWYCHELYAEHQKVLDDCLKVLLQYSHSLDKWASSDNPMQRVVKFTSSVTLKDITLMWRCWHEQNIAVPSVQLMHMSRCMELQKRGVLNDLELYGFSFAHSRVTINGDTADSIAAKVKARKPEVIGYVQSGNCFAENVIKNAKFLHSATSVNLTLYERTDGKYTLHYGSMPYSGYRHSIDFSPNSLASAGVSRQLCDAMLVDSKSFLSLPFLANSVQQFSMWVQSTSLTLNNRDVSISFTFNNLNAVSFCQELQQGNVANCSNKFDLIHASNLMDHLGPSGIILPSIPLLKSTSLLFATTLISKGFTNTVEDYLGTCFGFNCKLLPVILGIRCINHEGAGYSSPVMIEPNIVDCGDIYQVKQHEQTLIWEKVQAQPLVISELPSLAPGNITDALFDCVKTFALSLLTSYGDGQAIMNNNSLEEAIFVLQTFWSSTSTSNSSSYLFWESLVSALRLKLKPFLHCLQTQALLHDLHIHFTLYTDNCPKCTHTAIEKNIGLFCVEVPLPIKYMTPHFIAVVHKYSSEDAQYLCNEAVAGKDVHMFDCIDGKVSNMTLKLNFFAPIKFVADGYKVTLGLTFLTKEKNVIITALPTSSLKSMQVDFKPYAFPSISFVPQTDSGSCSFGQLVSHICDGNQVQSEVDLSQSAIEILSAHKLNTKQVSSREVQLSCGSLHYNLTFKYPVDYNQIRIKWSKARKKMEITSTRKCHNFEEEKILFVAVPDHQLSLPPLPVKDEIIVSHSGMQMYQEERDTVEASDGNNELLSPLLSVKNAFLHFFQSKKHYFHLSTFSVRGLLVINQFLFDYEHKTYAIDLAFSFLDQSPHADAIRKGWFSDLSMIDDGTTVAFNAEGYRLLQKTLLYFANRTVGNCQPTGKHSRYQMLCRQNIEQYFKRAVVYLLFRDPDHQGLDMINMINTAKIVPDFIKMHSPKQEQSGNPAIDEKCDYCGKYSPSTKKCTRCKKAQYCNRECQTKHWPVHSKSCKGHSSGAAEGSKPVHDTSSTLSRSSKKAVKTCSYCEKTSDVLKKCLRCEEVQYCGKECQSNHWPQHQKECKKSTQLAKSPAAAETSSKLATDSARGGQACTFCGEVSMKLLSCGRCGKVKYCGRDCQKKDWKSHKNTCN